MLPKITLVTTTIFDMPALDGYLEAALRYGGEVRVIVIPDRKTDPALFRRVKKLQRKGDGSRIKLDCPTLEEQETFLKKIGVPDDFIPYDSDNRRNVGFLMALAEPLDMLVSVDDDNFVWQRDSFFADHAVVCRGKHLEQVAHAPDGWLNPCDLLEYPKGQVLYPRGFPYRHRQANASLDIHESSVDIHLNLGLWLQDPDVDAISRLAGIVHTTGLKQSPVVLSPATWMPINTQNTALNSEALPAYYYIRMGCSLGGLSLDRFGDILSGYFFQACAVALGGSIRVGTPLVEHRRNAHNLLNDLTQELGGILLLEDLADWLTAQRITGSTYIECYEELANALARQAENFQGWVWEQGSRDFLKMTAQCMQIWLSACRTLLGK